MNPLSLRDKPRLRPSTCLLARILIVAVLAVLALPFGIAAAIGGGIVGSLISTSNPFLFGTSYPIIGGSTKSQITTAAADGEEVLYEHEVIMSSMQQNPFSDNMMGTLGSGKPIINHPDTSHIAGTAIVIPTVDPFGAPLVQGAGTRVGQEEQVKPGDFKLYVDLGWFGAGITNTGRSQTIVGLDWDELTKEGMAYRIAKQQSDDCMIALRNSAITGAGVYAQNTIFPNGKNIDSLAAADTFSYSLVVGSGGVARDIGARPINARPITDENYEESLRINRYLNFTTDANARPIKVDSAYVQALQLARERSDKNPLFTGDYVDVDNSILYPWQTIRHGGYGSIGAAIQPEALLGTAIPDPGTSSTLPAGSGILDGGGSATAAAVTPLRNYFEFWSLYTYTPINGRTSQLKYRSATRGYGAIQDSTTGKLILFSFTGNTGNQLTGVVVLGNSGTGNFATTLTGFSTGYNVAPFTTAADTSVGYAGYIDTSVTNTNMIASGSKMWEVNSKGQPIGMGFTLGEMALVCGYGRIPVGKSQFKTRASTTYYEAPHRQAFANGLDLCWGCAVFARPDSLAPNYVLQVFSRKVSGFPNIT